MVLNKLVVASQALLLASADGTFLAPQSLNEVKRTDTAAEVEKIQKIESSLRQVVMRLNGFSKKLKEQTSSALSRERADVAADVANMLADEQNPRLDKEYYTTATNPVDNPQLLTMDDLKKSTTWVNADMFLSNAEVSTTHIAIHALTALITTYLDNLVPNQEQVMRKDYWSHLAKRNWSNFFMQPVHNEVVGYIVPSFAKLGYHLIMGLTPRPSDLTNPNHRLTRTEFKRQIFQTPKMYPLPDTWTADNVEVVDDVQVNQPVRYKTKEIRMVPDETTAPADEWERNADDARKEKASVTTLKEAGSILPSDDKWGGQGQMDGGSGRKTDNLNTETNLLPPPWNKKVKDQPDFPRDESRNVLGKIENLATDFTVKKPKA